MATPTFEQLVEAGCHFGHLKRKWNPAMAPYIFMERNGIHIIDLYKTAAKIDEASAALRQMAKSGKKVLFVATKKQAKEAIASRQADIVVLDELNIVLATKMLPLDEVIAFLKEHQHNVEIITTGRGAPEELLKIADLVTDMSEVKHYFHKGVSSRLGIDH